MAQKANKAVIVTELINDTTLINHTRVVDPTFQRFLSRLISVAKDAADFVISAASRADANRALKAYANILREIWSDTFHFTGSNVPISDLDSAYFTLRSFMNVMEASTVASRRARLKCETSLEAIANFISEETLWNIEESVEVMLSSKRIKTLGGYMKNSAGSILAWQFIARLPRVPASAFIPSTENMELISLTSDEVEIGQRKPPANEKLQPCFDVWYGTNRRPVNPDHQELGFLNEKDPDNKMYYGKCSVRIPPSRKYGSIGTSRWKRLVSLKYVDDRYVLSLISPISSEDEFVNEIRNELELREEEERVALVYIHGYNTSFSEAALRAAQMGFDLKIPGITAFYSWPSRKNIIHYLADRDIIEGSEATLSDFLTTIATRSNATKVHVIAHSMGNRGFGRAIEIITSGVADAHNVRFGQIILAAADLNVDLFKRLARVYPKISDRTTLYVSSKDNALKIARFWQRGDRVGFAPPITVVDGVDTIDVSGIDKTILGHGYFSEAHPVLYDIQELIDSNKPPSKRSRVEPQIDEKGKQYWIIYG